MSLAPAPADQLLHLLAINPALDRAALAATFARDGRVQIRDVLNPASADALRSILARQTPWGLAWKAASDGPKGLTPKELAALPPVDRQARCRAARCRWLSHY